MSRLSEPNYPEQVHQRARIMTNLDIPKPVSMQYDCVESENEVVIVLAPFILASARPLLDSECCRVGAVGDFLRPTTRV